MEWEELCGRLERRFLSGAQGDQALDLWSEDDFNVLAIEAFAWQFELCAPYRALCERRQVLPHSIRNWREIPTVPAAAFKYFDFVSVPLEYAASEPTAVFHTSGTTRGSERRGRHIVYREALYRASFHHPFRLALLPDLERLPVLSLIPSPKDAPDSSLSWMAGMVVETFGDGFEWLVGADGVWHPEAPQVLLEAGRGDRPVLVLGTALAFVHLAELLDQGKIRLPDGSRIMETGGFKGARRSIGRSDLYASIATHTGVPEERIVNEYGMTELLSQMYEPVMTEGVDAQGLHVAPPWLQVRTLDPTSLEERPEGEEGIIAFFDLANLGSVSHVLTEDLGVIEGGRLRLLGRAPGSEPRGCSRAMDDLMAAVESR